MPRKIIPKECGCGCGGMTKGGQFIPGHDSILLSSIVQRVGGLLKLKTIVEDHIEEEVSVVETNREKKKTKNNKDFTCPECGYEFKGGTWGGIDSHWKARHRHIMSYEEAWELIRKGKYVNKVRMRKNIGTIIKWGKAYAQDNTRK